MVRPAITLYAGAAPPPAAGTTPRWRCTLASHEPGTRGPRSGLLWLSRETGQEVLRADGTVAGLVADLSVELDQPRGPQMVQRLLIRRRQAPGLLVPWTAVVEFGRHGVLLNDGIDTAVPFDPDGTGLRDHEILLLRDVLDTQVVDIVGQRLARVSDVVLNRTADGRLELVGAEVGFGGVLRRLGLHRLAVRAGDDVVDWTDLHLTSERGHTVQLNTPRSAVHHLDESALVALIDRLDVESAAEVLATTKPLVAARVIHGSDPVIGEKVLRAMPGDRAAHIVAAMPSAHAKRWLARLARAHAHPGRRSLRFQVWPRRRRTTGGRSR